ncbi:protein AKNAD1 [Phaenicophaeus curvirostris]|uniref:protein AKNAD1 n=1 Tax=Phaenicophaeus curvirostris TaxID=33595 RepID=UPI0037F0E7CB
MGTSVERAGSEASFEKELPTDGVSKLGSKEHLTNSKMSDVLLRHFSKGELISTCPLIECETIPETSLTESTDDAVSRPWPSEYAEGPGACEPWATNFEEYHLEKQEEVSTADKNKYLLNQSCISKKPVSSAAKCGCRQDHSPPINEDEDTRIFQNMKEETHLYKKTVSPHELKYGQAETHYCLPDFSKVALEVEVPKRNDSIKPVPTTERAESFPVSLRNSVIANVSGNKNCFHSAETENREEMSIPELWQQLEMLTQQAVTQNHPDHPRLNPKMLPQSDFPNAIYSGGSGTSSEALALHVSIPKQSTNGLPKARLHCGTTGSALPVAGPVEAGCLNHSNFLPELTVGEKMSQILKDQTAQLIKKVEDFSKYMILETFPLQDNYLALSQLKSHLDTLEKNYLTAREQHRYLQLQNYKDKSINVGEFDPERKVEGEIFRLGMLLEDIQEQTDDSKCNSLLTSYKSACSSPSPCERFLSPEEQYAAEGLAPHSQGTLSQIFNVDEESMNGNSNIHKRKTGTRSPFIQRKPTDLSDTNLSSDSEDTSAYDSYNDSLSEELVNCETESYRTFNTRLCGERKGLRCRCPTESRDQFKLRNYKDTLQSCALCRNRSSGSSSFSQKRISIHKPQKNKQRHELANQLSERQNIEAAKTCYSSTYDKIIFSRQYLPSKKSTRSKSAVNIRNRNTNGSNANILSSTLDHAIQTANSLKKTTEQMVRAVSEDLAKVKRKQL